MPKKDPRKPSPSIPQRIREIEDDIQQLTDMIGELNRNLNKKQDKSKPKPQKEVVE